MPTMGRYCKAYPLSALRRYASWSEAADNARPEEREAGGGTPLPAPRTLDDDSYVFLHDTFIVTDGVFLDEYVIFDASTPAWEEFCRNELAFVVPDASPAVAS